MDDLAEIYRRHARAVFSYARSLTRNTEEAEDLVSETFVRAVLHRHDIRTATVRGYLLTTVRNLFLNSRRRAGREVDLDEERADHSPAVDRLIDGRQLADRARVAMASLGDGERRALRLRADEGCPTDRSAKRWAYRPGRQDAREARAPVVFDAFGIGGSQKIAIDVLRDLWPAYQQGTASEATRQLIDECLADEPDLRSRLGSVRGGTQSAWSPEAEARLLEEIRRKLRSRTYLMAAAMTLSTLLIGTMLMFGVMLPSLLNR
jgi:RNA polymerase sigma-70 factor (ECF subfamily)